MAASTPAPHQRVFFDFVIADKPRGRVVFELFNNVVSKTTENFRALCTGEKGASALSGVPLHYKGCPVHRVIEGFMIQGGDFTKRNGTGGESIYGGKTFKDERLKGPGTEVDREGLLVMANAGPDTNRSQFFITLAPAPHLTGKHVVFGRVIHNMEIIHEIGKLAVDANDKPLSPVIIGHCGELEMRRKAPPAPAPTRARSPSRSASPSSRSSRSNSRSRSPPRRRRYSSSGGESSEDDRPRKAAARRRRDSSASAGRASPARGTEDSKEPKEETEAELDARLEREEKERLAAEAEARKAEWEEKQRALRENGGVVYKGRGKMRYRDPETTGYRGMPTNISSYGPDSRSRYGGGGAGRGGRGGGAPAGERRDGVHADRWVQGVDARPTFNAERRDGELERHRTKGEGNRRGFGYGADNWKHDRDGAGDGAAGARDDRRRDWNDRFARKRSASPDRADAARDEGRGGLSLKDRIGALPAQENADAEADKEQEEPVVIRELPLRGDRSDSEDMDIADD